VPRFHRWGRRATLEIEELDDAPLLLLRRNFGSRAWFDAARQIAHVRPRVLLESDVPPALVALAQAAYGIAIVPSSVRIPRGSVRTMTILRRGEPLGQWASVSWDPRRFLAPYGEQSITELVAYTRRYRPWRLHPARVALTATRGAGGMSREPRPDRLLATDSARQCAFQARSTRPGSAPVCLPCSRTT
jgi:LysR family cyn operon transcriptional activator